MIRRLATRAAIAVATLAAGLAAPAQAAPPATLAPGLLTVGVSMPSEGFQVGVINGSEVLYARGLEIDLAREISSRLELTGTTFVQQDFPRLVGTTQKPWDLAIAQVTITASRERHVDFTVPYMDADQGVLLSQYVRTRPTRRAQLRGLRLCSELGTTGVSTVRQKIRPTAKPKWFKDVSSLMLALQVGSCDAVVYDLPTLATLEDRAPGRYGPLVGKIDTAERYGIVLPEGSTLKDRVDGIVTALRSDGTLSRLQRTWLSRSLGSVRSLR